MVHMKDKKTKNILDNFYMPKSALNNNIPIVRNVVYKRINDMKKDIKDLSPDLSNFFIDKVDTQMKNTINKILNDYSVAVGDRDIA